MRIAICDDDPLFACPGKQIGKAFADLVLGGGEAGALGVGGIAEQRQHAPAAVLGNGGQIGGIAGNGGVVYLEVAGLDDHAGGTLDGVGHRVGNGVVHMDGLDGKAAQTEFLPGLDLVHLGAAPQPVLLQLVAQKAQREPGGVDGHIDLLEQIGNGTDVVLVAVGDEQAADLILVLHDKGEVGDHQIHAEHIAVGENRTAVHNEHIPLALVDGEVLADLAQTAQGVQMYRGQLGLAALGLTPALGLAAGGVLLPGGGSGRILLGGRLGSPGLAGPGRSRFGRRLGCPGFAGGFGGAGPGLALGGRIAFVHFIHI